MNCNYYPDGKVDPFFWLLKTIRHCDYFVRRLCIQGKQFNYNNVVTMEVLNKFKILDDNILANKLHRIENPLDLEGIPNFDPPSGKEIQNKVDDILLGEETSEEMEKFCKMLQGNEPTNFIKSLLWRYLPKQLNELHLISEIAESDFRYLDSSFTEYDRAIEMFKIDFNQLHVLEIWSKIWHGHVHPKFDLHKNYMSLYESKICIREWLIFQFGQEWKNYLLKFFQILTKVGTRNFKMNCIWLWGPRDSGKTKTIESLLELFILVGYLINCTESERFPFTTIVGVRAVLMDEPRIAKLLNEQFKILLANQRLIANIRYNNGGATVSGVPFVMLSNNDNVVDWEDEAWHSRILRLQVKALPENFLHDQIPKITHFSPVAWLHLFHEELGIQF